MQTATKPYNGKLISELGVKRYLKAINDIRHSNINFLIRGEAADKAWSDCDFGCHGPTYRQLKRPSTYAEALKPIDEFSPALAGFIDGINTNSVGKIQRLADGTERTAEGLHLVGSDRFYKVGDENYAAYQLITSTFEKVINFELNLIDNPISQIVMAIVNDYVAILPEWVLEEIAEQGALQFPSSIDTTYVIKAAALGVIDNISSDDLSLAAQKLQSPTQRVIGKNIGKKVPAALTAIISSYITKKLIKESVETHQLKRNLAKLRKLGRNAKGGLGGALITLLESQGLLGQAAKSSRKLQSDSPRLWNILRNNLRGANMVYFLVENITQEYIDRLVLLRDNPLQFANIMRALIRDKHTPSIFLPNITLNN